MTSKAVTAPSRDLFLRQNEFGKVKRYDGKEAIGQKDFPAWFDLPCQEAQCTRLADYILEEDPYPIKAVFSAGMNHRMWPKPGHLLEALKKLDFYVNTDMFWSDASTVADLVLPACTSYEREEVQTKPGDVFLLQSGCGAFGRSEKRYRDHHGSDEADGA